MIPATTIRKKPKSPGVDAAFNPKTSVTCINVPEALFDSTTAKKHFSKFGRLQRIRLFPKQQTCIVEYEQPLSAERAVLNAGAFDGFMFDVTRTKQRMRKRSKKEDDPDWVPDSDVEKELSAMSGAPTPHMVTRNNSMDIEPVPSKPKITLRAAQTLPLRKKVVFTPKSTVLQKKAPDRKIAPSKPQPVSGVESPVLVSTQTTLSTYEAATELHQLRFKVSLTPDEQWRILDARDRILRGWGGAGSRVKEGGATIGTCQDMCPEKELLHRQSEHQVMTLETVLDSDGQLDPWRAVKQYSRSSADQEIPMCYELRPAPALMMTCTYLLHEIADTTRQVTLADWFHFMWDRLRSIRKDITQQALCCAESIRLVEMCARFHAHCAARLADLEHTQFDQKLNTDNLTKCLQTLKHMYDDVTAEMRPREAEFRGYIALLNLGDANFWWEIKQLPHEMQKSSPIVFAIKVFNALDNNNYVRFFRLVRQEATYLQACILLRYFNDVRARALARIVKAYAPRGGARFPADDMMSALAFESVDKMKAFICHYGLRFGRIEENEPSIILSRHQFIEDSDPFPTARAVNLIESKRQCSVGEVIAGGPLPSPDYKRHVLHTSFTKDGKLKESALVAEEQGFNTINDSNKDIKALKAEIHRLAQGGRTYTNTEVTPESKYVKPDAKGLSPRPITSVFTTLPSRPIEPVFNKLPSVAADRKMFSFKPAILVDSTDVLKDSPEKMFDDDVKNIFSFSKPQETAGSNLFSEKDSALPSKNLFENKVPSPKSLFKNTELKNQQESKSLFGNTAIGSKSLFENKRLTDPKSVFGSVTNEKRDLFQNTQNVFKSFKPEELLLGKPDKAKSIFGQNADTRQSDSGKNLFGNTQISDNGNVVATPKSIFASAKENSLFAKSDTTANIGKGNYLFTKPVQESQDIKPANVFAAFNKESDHNFTFARPDLESNKNAQSIFAPNGGATSGKVSPGNFFKSVLNPPNGSDAKGYAIFQSKNKAQTVADNILNSISSGTNNDIYQFDQDEENQNQMQMLLNEEKLRQEREQQRQEEERKQELRRQKELMLQEEAKRKQEEQKVLEEQRKREEKRKQEELKKKLEAEKQAELKRLAEEKEKKFRKAVEKESTELMDELVNEVNDETSREILREEQEKLRTLIKFANDSCEQIITEMCNEICQLEMKAERFRTYKIMRKWFTIWRQHLIRNLKRRRLLDDTPVWLPERTPIEEASQLRRNVESMALKNMNDFHNGYRFSGELKQLPSPQPYYLLDIIRSPLLRRMKEISYPYDKCFFWKVTLVAPGEDTWLCRKINIQKWLLDAFSDSKRHEESETLIHVGKESWNHLMDFAISVSLVNIQKMANCSEAIEGTNGILFYFTENHSNLIEIIQETLKQKYPYQVVPVAIIMPKTDVCTSSLLQNILSGCVERKIISGFKVFFLEPQNISELLNASTKKALKWLSRKYPQTPPLEIDYLKSICQRYLGNEIWCRLRTERDGRMDEVLKDIQKLIKCYNAAVDRLTCVITNEDLFNYTSFPLEFNQFLDQLSPYPKPYEFIPSSVRTSENLFTIKDIMMQLKLPNPSTTFNPKSVINMQQQIRTYCNQIGWFENPEEVVCKVVAVIPNELSDLNMSSENFTQYFAHYDLIDVLNIIVYEKINRLNRFDNRFAIYEQSVLHEYRNIDWLYEVDALSQMKHKVIDCEDEVDFFIEAKRRKIAMESLEYLTLEDKDETLVDETVREANASIIKLTNCSEAVKQLDKKIEEGKRRSVEFENMLKAALDNV